MLLLLLLLLLFLVFVILRFTILLGLPAKFVEQTLAQPGSHADLPLPPPPPAVSPLVHHRRRSLLAVHFD